jgi:quercetin dioxygenase-like cupin family protein
MSVPRSDSGEVIDVRPLVAAPPELKATTLVKTEALEVRRLVFPKGREVPTHRATGEITVHCLEGRVAFTAGGTTRTLEAGQMLWLGAGEPHSLIGLEASSLLVTKLLADRPSGP